MYIKNINFLIYEHVLKKYLSLCAVIGVFLYKSFKYKFKFKLINIEKTTLY